MAWLLDEMCHGKFQGAGVADKRDTGETCFWRMIPQVRCWGPNLSGSSGNGRDFVGDEDGDWLVETCLIMSSLHHLQTTSNQDEQGSCGWQTPHAHTGNDLHRA